MKIWQKEKISVEKLQKKLNLRESKRLDVLLNDVGAKMLCLSEIRLYDNLPLLSNKAGLLENKRGLLFLYGICRFMWRILVGRRNHYIYMWFRQPTKICSRVRRLMRCRETTECCRPIRIIACRLAIRR